MRESTNHLKEPLRVLHVLSSLGQGGIEKWLLHLTLEIHRQFGREVETEFLTFLSPGGYYESTFVEMGCNVQHCQLYWPSLPGFIYRLARCLHNGRYDVVHCHADYLSGLILPVAHAVGVRTRICHIHATRFSFQARRPLLRHWVGRLLRRMNVWDGGVCVGTSEIAINAYLGKLKSRIRHQVSVCGIPCEDSRAVVNISKKSIRDSLHWQGDSKVVLHVGRHDEAKNLGFLLEVFAEILRLDRDVTCVLAGSGPLTLALESKAKNLGISENVIFLGIRDDVPQLMRAADLFILPSLYEGLGLVVIEAQAVGLRSLISSDVPDEVEVVPGLVHRLPCVESSQVWAERALDLLEMREGEAETSLRLAESSPFSISSSARGMMRLYTGVNEG